LNQKSLYVVVTTIQPPTKAMRDLGRVVQKCGGQFIVAGDKKGPFEYRLPNVEFLSLEQQLKMPFSLMSLLPMNHYARKNSAYLAAIGQGAPCIYETDDDNAPTKKWAPRSPEVKALPVRQAGWCNVYSYFSDKYLWPRGFPLDDIAGSRKWKSNAVLKARTCRCPIQQGLADGSPDVDAIWRLVLDQDIRFKPKPSLALTRGTWCPFNSQSTWWWPEAYPLMYMPSYCTVRMTDIWRSFIAQRCVWELGAPMIFHAAEVFQDRNVHRLVRDFQDEVPGYLNNTALCKTLAELPLKPGEKAVGDNLLQCYQALVRTNIFPEGELPLVEAWLADLKKIAEGAHL
jgi:hypothetical protein